MRTLAGHTYALVAFGLALIMTGLSAHAQSSGSTPAFDYTVFSGSLTSGLTVIGTVAAGIAAILAAVMIWKKIAKYFQKAG